MKEELFPEDLGDANQLVGNSISRDILNDEASIITTVSEVGVYREYLTRDNDATYVLIKRINIGPSKTSELLSDYHKRVFKWLNK